MAPTRRILLLLLLASGALRLMHLAVWIRRLAYDLSATPGSLAAIIAAILVGMTAGSLVFGRYADRSGRHPLAVYGLLEIGIGLYAVISPVFLALPGYALAWAGGAPGGVGGFAVRLILSLVALGIPSALMGGSFPALSRVTARSVNDAGWTVGALHAAGLLGVAGGAAGAFFRVIPGAGLRATSLMAAAGSILAGLVALELVRRWWREGTEVPGPVTAALPEPPPAAGLGPAGLGILAAGSGLAMALYFTAWKRVLGLVLGSSVQADAAVFVTFVGGLALGALIGARIADRLSPAEGYGLAAGVLAGAGLAGHATFIQVPQLPVTFALAFHGFGLAGVVPAGTLGWAARLAGIQFMVSVAAILPVAIFLGTVFPLLIRLRIGSLDGLGSHMGALQAASLGGLAAGVAVASQVFIPMAGLRSAILIALAVALLTALAAAWIATGWHMAWRVTASLAAAAALVFVLRGGPPWDPYVMSSGVYAYATDWLPADLNARSFAAMLHRNQELLFHREGRSATVLVSRDTGSGEVWMAVDGRQDAGSRTGLATQLLLGHLPMLHLDPARERPAVAVLGYGTGITTGAVALHPAGRIVVVEPEPAVLAGAASFVPWSHDPLDDHRVEVASSDGRGFLRGTREHFDVIVSAPWGGWTGPAALLTTAEFLEAARARLRPGGIFCQRLSIDELEPDEVRVAFRTFNRVFDRVKAYMPVPWGDIILMGSDVPFPVDPDRVASWLSDERVARDLAGIRIRTVEDLLTYHLMNDPEARAFPGEGMTNTDDNALLEFAAPLSMNTATPEAHRLALSLHTGDPLDGAAGGPAAPEVRAAAYQRLGRAFFDRGMARRALAAQRRAQEIAPTAAGSDLLDLYRSRIPGEAGR